MFTWRVSTYAQQSPVDAVLDKGHVVLEDLLDIDDLAKEARVLNGRLVTYLKKPDTLRQLLEYLLGRPPAPKTGQPSSQEEADARTKHSLAACEVLCSLAEEAPGVLAGNNELLRLLFSATGSPTSLDCTLAGYFARLVGILLTRCPEQTLAFLEANRSVLDLLLEHLDTAGMAETFVRIVGADEQAVPNLPQESLAWLPEMDIIARLLARLEEDVKVGAHGNVAEVLAAIARSRSSPLTRQLCDPSNLSTLISKAVVAPPQTPSVQALNIYIALLERRRLLATVLRTSAEISAANAEADANLSKVIAAMVPHTPTLAAVLSTAHSTALLETSYGVLRPPLGSVRLTVIELVAVLLRTGSKEAEAAIIASGIVREILAVFLRFPFNSILHHQVTSIIACMLEAGSDAVVGHLFGDCDLLGWLLNAPAQCEPEQRPGDTRERRPLRAGYMGHLTEIANSLQTVAARRPPVAQLLCSSTPWTQFAFGPLSERNQLEDVLSWRCGHPQVRGGAQAQAAKDGDTEMPDLQLDALASLDRHASRYSAFSDDEDEDELHSLYLDASGDSDLWDLAAAESGEAIQRHESASSPFASRSLLGSFDMEEERDPSWMRRPTLLSRPSLTSSADGDTLDGHSSPPATWEDRADGNFDSSANWMDTDDLDEDGTVLTASPEPESSKGGTPDLLADSPPKQPDAPSPNASRVTPRVLFPALFPTPTSPPAPSTQAPSSPTAAAGLPHHAQETTTPLQRTGSSSPRRRSFEKEASGDQEQEPTPVGCYSTLAAHHREEPSGIGHELPACFASPPTSPPQTARSRHAEEPMDTISLADAPPAVPPSAAHSATPKVTVIGAVKRTEAEWPDGAEDDCSASTTSEKGGAGGSGKAVGTPMGGLRDLFGPMGGLFKGAFSQPASGASADGARQEGHQVQEGSHAATAGKVGLNGESADDAQPGHAGPASELTQVLIAALPRKGPVSYQGHGSVVKLPKVTRLAGGSSMSSASNDSPGIPAEAVGGQAEAGPSTRAVDSGMRWTLPVLNAHPELTQSKEQPSAEVSSGSRQEAAFAGSLLAADEPSADSDSMDTEQPQSMGLGQSRTEERASGVASNKEHNVPNPVDACHSSTEHLESATPTGEDDLHKDALEHEAHSLNSSESEQSKDDQEAPANASVQAPTAPSSRAHYHHSEVPSAELNEGADGVSGSMQGGPSQESGPAQRPFRGRHRRWAEGDAVLVPRGESEEETLVGSFTKLLVSQEDEFSEGRRGIAPAGAPGQPGRLGLSCAQQAPKPAHQPAVEREWPE